MGEHELELHGKLGLPEVGGFAARIEARFKSSWGRRGTELVEVVQDKTGSSQEQLVERLEEDERLRDAFLGAGQRAVEVADPEYRAVLGRIVAAAFDDAKVDEAEYLLAQLIKLEPLHIRALVAAFEFWRSIGENKLAQATLHDATHFAASRIRAEVLASRLQIDINLAASALDVLTSAGLLEEVPDDRPMTYGELGTGRVLRERSWRPTSWGIAALKTVFPELQVH